MGTRIHVLKYARLYGGPHDGEFVPIDAFSPPPHIAMYSMPPEALRPLQPWVEEFQYATVADTTVYDRFVWRDGLTDEVRYYVRED